MIGINTNITSLQIQRSFQQQQGKEVAAMEHLSTGKRVNSSKDDAASLFTIQKQTMDIKASQQISRGVSDAISYSQIAEGALSEIQALLQRANEIAIQSANGTVEDRSGLQKEWTQIKEQVDQITQGTSIFGKNPFFKTSENDTLLNEILGNGETLARKHDSSSFAALSKLIAVIPAGTKNLNLIIEASMTNTLDDQDIQIFTKSGKHIVGTQISPLLDETWSVWGINSLTQMNSKLILEENGFDSTATYDSTSLNMGSISGNEFNNPSTFSTTYNDMTISYSGDSDRATPTPNFNDRTLDDPGEDPKEIVTIDDVTEDLLIFVTGSGDINDAFEFTVTGSWDFMPEKQTDVKILTDTRPTDSSSFVTIDKTVVDTATLSINSLDLSSQSNAQTAITSIQSAIDTISQHRAYYGAIINRMETTRESVTNHGFQTTQSRSRIEDVDFASETAQLTRAQILKQAAMSMVGHVKTSQQQVLALLNAGLN